MRQEVMEAIVKKQDTTKHGNKKIINFRKSIEKKKSLMRIIHAKIHGSRALALQVDFDKAILVQYN